MTDLKILVREHVDISHKNKEYDKCLSLVCTRPRAISCITCPNYLYNAIKEYETLCRENEDFDFLPCCKTCRHANNNHMCKNCVLGDMYEDIKENNTFD